MKVKITKISIRNFKGIKSLDLPVGRDYTNIHGDNGTGKTTIQDAFSWLFFGKDSLNRKVFDIKPKDSGGNLIPYKEPEVEIGLLIDDRPVLLTRTFIEKWERAEGTEEKVYKGNSTKYKIDQIERSTTDFNEVINSIANEEMFKLITSPTYFCSLDDKRQRKMLVKLAGGDITDEEVLSTRTTEFTTLRELLPNNTLDNLKKENDSKIKLIKAEIADLPTKILEAEKAIPEELDWKEIEDKITTHKAEQEKERKKIQEIDDVLTEYSNSITVASNKRIEEKKVIAENEDLISDRKPIVKQNLLKAYNTEQNLISSKNQLIEEEKTKSTTLTNKQDACSKNIENYTTNLTLLQNTEKLLVSEYNKKIIEEYNPDSSTFVCPYTNSICSIVGSLQEEGKQAFLNKKAEDLKAIQTKGKANKELIKITEQSIKDEETKIADYLLDIKEIEATIISIQAEINLLATPKPTNTEVEEAYTKDEEIKRILAINKNLTDKLTPIKESPITPEQLQDKKTYQENINNIQITIDELNQSIGNKDLIANQKLRVETLNQELRLQSIELAKLEKIDFEFSQFNKIKMTAIEDKVNSMFAIVRFKMFNQLLNGGEEETCEAMINGVSWSKTLNSGAKINAGLDIINTFSNKFDLYAPIFIDNKESVTKLIETNTQMINLIVDESAKSLTIK